MRRAAAAIALSLALSPLLAACGDDEPEEPKAPTKEEWSAEADKICEAAQTEVDKLGPAPIGEIAKLPDWAKNGVAIRTKQINDLKALEEPTDMKADIDATLTEATQLLEQAKTSLTGAATPALVGSLTELQLKQQELQKEIAAYGPAKCGPK